MVHPVYDVDVCVTVISDKPPQLPIREALLSLGIETVHKPRGSVSAAATHTRDKRLRKYQERQDEIRIPVRSAKHEVKNKAKNWVSDNEKPRIQEELHKLKSLSYAEYNDFRIQIKDDESESESESALSDCAVLVSMTEKDDNTSDGDSRQDNLDREERDEYNAETQPFDEASMPTGHYLMKNVSSSCDDTELVAPVATEEADAMEVTAKVKTAEVAKEKGTTTEEAKAEEEAGQAVAVEVAKAHAEEEVRASAAATEERKAAAVLLAAEEVAIALAAIGAEKRKAAEAAAKAKADEEVRVKNMAVAAEEAAVALAAAEVVAKAKADEEVRVKNMALAAEVVAKAEADEEVRVKNMAVAAAEVQMLRIALAKEEVRVKNMAVAAEEAAAAALALAEEDTSKIRASEVAAKLEVEEEANAKAVDTVVLEEEPSNAAEEGKLAAEVEKVETKEKAAIQDVDRREDMIFSAANMSDHLIDCGELSDSAEGEDHVGEDSEEECLADSSRESPKHNIKLVGLPFNAFTTDWMTAKANLQNIKLVPVVVEDKTKIKLKPGKLKVTSLVPFFEKMIQEEENDKAASAFPSSFSFES